MQNDPSSRQCLISCCIISESNVIRAGIRRSYCKPIYSPDIAPFNIHFRSMQHALGYTSIISKMYENLLKIILIPKNIFIVTESFVRKIEKIIQNEGKYFN